MSGLRELKKKITTVNKIKKIFSVMKMIASSKMKRANEDVILSNQTIDLIRDMLISAINNSSDISKAFSFLNINKINNEAPILYLLISSDKGLCGNYNSLVIRKFTSIIKNENNYKVIFAGRKVKNILSNKINHDNIIHDLSNFKFNELISNYDKISTILNRVFELFNNGEISDCKIVYVFSENIMSKKVIVESIFNFSEFSQLQKSINNSNNLSINDEEYKIVESIANDKKIDQDGIIFEPNEEVNIKTIKNLYFRAKFFNFFRNAYFSELTSRMIAMDSANRNSSELAKKMTLRYNKKRQENITKELIDIVNGSENV